MRDAVNAYIAASENLLTAFGCPEPYFIRPVKCRNWQITHGEVPILSILADDGVQNAVIVRQDGHPLIYRAKGYALVIAIDCVKIAFLMDEKQERRP